MDAEINMKRKKTDEKDITQHKKKRRFSKELENKDVENEGPKIINVLAQKSRVKLRPKKDKKATQSEVKAPKKRKKRKKKSKADSEAVKANGEPPEEKDNPNKKAKKLKKTKAEKMSELISSDKSHHETPTQNKAMAYLKTWKESPSTWKFNKCSQIWLLQNAYCEAKIPDKNFDVLLEYMVTIKGKMKDVALERSQKIIELESKWVELEGTKTIDEIQKDVGEARPTEKKLNRAKEVQIMFEGK
eukprot:TRINITY_DN2499_c0_g1_i1.p1 TRINITY_DN2499_c0_g1~~TRINITY_DN2499_c0_g1_i1.p1  ORF type:complete len:245 (+),score=66.49 TRINITY_DN2499_c0_g1_i1:79-813(+)